jgi:7-cyano-7-deazaguanine synthase
MKSPLAIALLSGGLDSAVSSALSLKKGYKIKLAITFDYGQKAVKQEIRSAKYFCKRYYIKHEIFNVKWLGKLASNPLTDKTRPVPHKIASHLVWIPNRNGLFINIAGCFAEALSYQYIITGFNREEARNFPDNSIAFINFINKSLSYSTLKGVKVISFTARMDKPQIIEKALDLNLSLDKLWSCYEGSKKPCGVCESCSRRLSASGTYK